MREFIQKKDIKPITQEQGVGYVLLVNQHKPLQAKVMVLVSSAMIYHPLFAFQLITQNIHLQYPSSAAHFNLSLFVYSTHGKSLCYLFIECIRQFGVKNDNPLRVCALSIYQSNDKADGLTIAEKLAPNQNLDLLQQC